MQSVLSVDPSICAVRFFRTRKFFPDVWLLPACPPEGCIDDEIPVDPGPPLLGLFGLTIGVLCHIRSYHFFELFAPWPPVVPTPLLPLEPNADHVLEELSELVCKSLYKHYCNDYESDILVLKRLLSI